MRPPRSGPRYPISTGAGPLFRRLGLVFLLAACGGEDPASEGESETSYGPAVLFGGGTARTYIVSEVGTPLEIGVALDAATLGNLPPQHGPGSIPMPDGNSTYEYLLELPSENPTPFRHVTLDWNPGGHEPPGVYDTPHFDVHFYLISNDERHRIDPADPAFAALAAETPAPDFMPPGYIHPFPEPTAVPMMGVHWLDPNSPELSGAGPFSATLIYGTWNGQLIFVEPMFTLALLESRPTAGGTFPVPARFSSPGAYPSEYSVRWEAAAGEYRISLGSFRASE